MRQVQNTPVTQGTKTEAEKQLSSCSKVMGLKVALDPNLSFIDLKYMLKKKNCTVLPSYSVLKAIQIDENDALMLKRF